jgi:twitching motility protein PilT
MLQRGADDLFLFAGRAPYVKVDGKVEPLGESILASARIRELIEAHLTPAQRDALDQRKDVDFSYDFAARSVRFRVNVFLQLTGIAAVFRVVKNDILTLDDLGVPPVVSGFAKLPNGLVLVGGPTGAGKSTTLAALIDHINRTVPRHIVTLEDPIERVHSPRESVVNQRELGPHTRTFSSALRSTMRQDPDVILVGELRDLDTIAFAISAAETGHLVLGSVHTTSADATVDRLINSFPARQQAQIRGMLADSLRAVTNQYLLRTPDGGRRPAVEVMINNEAIQSLIRKGKTFQIPTVVATSRDVGMQSMDAELLRLAKEGLVDVDDAYAKTVDKRAFEAALGLPSPEGALGPPSIRPGATPPPQKISPPSVPPHSDRRAIVQEPSRSLRPGDPRIIGGRGERGGS